MGDSVKRVALIGAWLGLGAGLGEVGLLAIARHGLGRLVQANPQNIWMAPLAYATLFACLNLATTLALSRNPARARRLSFAVPIFLGCLGTLFLLQHLHRLAAMCIAAALAFQGSAIGVRHHEMVVRWIRRTIWPLVAMPVILFAALNASTALEERDAAAAIRRIPARFDAPNVLLIVWDTVRARNLSAYGYERQTTPTLERLAQRGVLFERATSPAPWTLPSHGSMFTGNLPRELGVDWWRPLDTRSPTLAELFSASGYVTGGFSANVLWGGRNAGLHRGFSRFVDYPRFSLGYFATGTSLARAVVNVTAVRRAVGLRDKVGRRTAPAISTELLAWLDENRDRPFFAFLNYFDAHSPYAPPPPFDSRFGPPSERRWPFKTEGSSIDASEVSAEVAAYDGAIAYLDDHLRLLLEELEAREVLQRTLVIVTADHGEEFGEHKVYWHGNSLYDPSLHVPLVIALPGRVPEGRRVQLWVETRDIAATVQELVDLRSPTTLPGHSLQRTWQFDMPPEAEEPTIAEVPEASGHPWWYPVSKGDLVAVMTRPFKYIRTGDGLEEVYNLEADPDEQHDLTKTIPYEVLRTLRENTH